LEGSTVGPYQILDKLGSGGMGEVFLCHDSRLQRKVALKCLTSGEPSVVEEANILREARAAARLTHPHIASVYDVLEHEGRPFIVMEYVEGESLRACLRNGALPPDKVIAIGRQLASALAAAHAQGVIHRDLKPSNVQVMPDGTIKVLDFGIAKLMPRVERTTDAPTTTHMVSRERSEALGTPVYMAPEQLISGHVDARSDVYSLGVLLFEMTAGRRPFVETDAVALAVAMSTLPPPPPDAIDPRVPHRLSSVIVKALQREPFNRYQSAQELAAALDELSEPTTRGVVRPARVGRRRRMSKWAIAVASLLAIGVVAWRPLLTRVGILKSAGRAPHAALAILPVDNPTGDVRAEYLGAGIAAVVASNFGSIPGLTVIPRTSTAPYETRRNDLAAMHREIGADYVLDLTMKSAAPRAELVARLRRTDAVAPVWEQTIGGDALAVERMLLESLARVLEGQALSRPLNAAEYARIRRVPTTSGEALLAYAEARALIGPLNSPETSALAISLLQGATAKDPLFALAFAALGDAYWQKYERDKDPDLVSKATAAVTEALRIDPNQAPVYYSLGNMYQQTGRYEEAIAAFRRAIQIQPDNDESHALLARVLAAKGDYSAASDEAQRAVDIRPSWNTYFNQGRVQFAAGHFDKALVALRRTTELNPTFAGGFQMLGATYQMQGDFANAIGNYEHSIRLAPNAPAYTNLAIAYLRAKRYTEAIAAFNEALKHDPQQASRYRNLADAYKIAGRIADARDYYAKAITVARRQLAVNPRDVITIALVALCEANLGRRAEAERHAAEAATLGATNAELRFRLTKVYAALNNRAAAFATLRAAIAAGYDPKAAREDEELAPLRGADFDAALAEGVARRDSGRSQPK
jgi:tetratricopeptide (TPR) repeat protein